MFFVGDAEIRRRSNDTSAPPDGGDNPYITADNMFLLDIIFLDRLVLYSKPVGYNKIAEELEGVEGVGPHGLLPSVQHLVIPVGGTV